MENSFLAVRRELHRYNYCTWLWLRSPVELPLIYVVVVARSYKNIGLMGMYLSSELMVKKVMCDNGVCKRKSWKIEL